MTTPYDEDAAKAAEYLPFTELEARRKHVGNNAHPECMEWYNKLTPIIGEERRRG